MRVLCVCLGNICRSPAAEAVFEKLIAERGLHQRVELDSAGTSGWHRGAPADSRMQAAGQKRGLILRSRSRPVDPVDFELFDHILAMDSDNLAWLQAEKPGGSRAQLSLILDWHPASEIRNVPDPYYGGAQGFEHVLDLLEPACAGFLDKFIHP